MSKNEKPPKVPSNEPVHTQIPISEYDICRAWIEVCETHGIKNEDAPSERDLINVRDQLGTCYGHISLHWIRNKFVQLRKAKKIKGYRDTR